MVRKFQLDDAEDIYKLGELVVSNFSKLYDLKQIYDEKFSYIYVYDDKGIKGFIHVTKLYEMMDVVNIVVDSKERRKGIASLLIDYVISEFDDLKLITLEVDVNNLPAINLYKKFGFKVVNIRKNYYKTGDAYLMQRSV